MFKKTIMKGVVQDGKEYFVKIPEHFLQHFITITFFDENNQYVPQTQGTAEFTVTDDGYSWGGITNGLITFDETGNYNRPNASCSISKVKLKLNGITATRFEAAIKSFGP